MKVKNDELPLPPDDPEWEFVCTQCFEQPTSVSFATFLSDDGLIYTGSQVLQPCGHVGSLKVIARRAGAWDEPTADVTDGRAAP